MFQEDVLHALPETPPHKRHKSIAVKIRTGHPVSRHPAPTELSTELSTASCCRPLLLYQAA